MTAEWLWFLIASMAPRSPSHPADRPPSGWRRRPLLCAIVTHHA